MAGFCNQCGRPLADGEVCTCTQQTAAGQQFQYDPAANAQQQSGAGEQQSSENVQQPYNGNGQPVNNGQPMMNNGQPVYNGQPMNNGQMPYGMPVPPQQPSQAAIKFAQFGKDLVASLKNPVSAIGEIAGRNDFLYGLLMVCIDAVIIFFVTLILAGKVNSSISSMLGVLGSYSSYVSIGVPMAKMAFITFIAVIAAYAAQAGTLLGMTKALCKNSPITFIQSLTYVGGKAFYSAMVAIVSGIFCLVNLQFGAIIFAIGSMLAFLVGALSYYQTVVADGMRKLYVLLVVYVANLLVVYLAARLLISTAMSSLGMSSISSLYNLLY